MLTSTMTVYPGTCQPKIKAYAEIETHDFRETHFEITSHMGTHIDAPAHILRKGTYLNQYPLDKFIGTATIIDCIGLDLVQSGGTIPVEHLKKSESLIIQSEFVIIKTGWHKLWGMPEYITTFPTLSHESIEWLCTLSLKGLGVDTLSVDPYNAVTSPLDNHINLLKHDCLIIENLTNLEAIVTPKCTFIAMPLSYEHSDGSPVRAAALC